MSDEERMQLYGLDYIRSQNESNVDNGEFGLNFNRRSKRYVEESQVKREKLEGELFSFLINEIIFCVTIILIFFVTTGYFTYKKFKPPKERNCVVEYDEDTTTNKYESKSWSKATSSTTTKNFSEPQNTIT
uniref:Uncharacterized protein n=1 Tax=Parastrongyloides trichosuri TaxID=131310 RepID=A0A0N4Z7I0_PARTI